LKQEDVEEYVLTMLGVNRIGVEIDAKEILVCTKQALRKYALYVPKLKNAYFTSAPGVQVYKIDTEGMPPCFVNPRSATPLPGLVDANFDVFKYPFYEAIAGPAIAGTFSGIGHIELYFQWLNATAKVLSSDFDWMYDEETGSLMVTPPPQAVIAFQVIYPAPRDIKNVPVNDEDIVLDLALAYGKQILGRILRKFKEIPGSTLTIPTDGAELMQEGLQAETTVLDNLKARSLPPPFIIG
jgi:hypothetical protein